MNENHERDHARIDRAEREAVSRAKQRGGMSIKAKDYSDGRECRPAKISGWRPARGFDPRAFDTALSVSAWLRRGVFVVSALELAEAPDGTGETIEQWHASISKASDGDPNDVASRRASDEEVRQTLASLGMAGAEEDNHHPGIARHFWVPVDPKRRRDCECKVTETTVVGPDGYKWSTPTDDRECHGCEYEVMMAGQKVTAPCPIHKPRQVDLDQVPAWNDPRAPK